MPRSASAAPVQAPAPLTDSMVPKHVQLRESLLRLVREELSPGDALPSERELMAHHGVSRATVRIRPSDTIGSSRRVERARRPSLAD